MSTATFRQNAPQTMGRPALLREFVAALPIVIFARAVREALQATRAPARQGLRPTSR